MADRCSTSRFRLLHFTMRTKFLDDFAHISPFKFSTGAGMVLQGSKQIYRIDRSFTSSLRMHTREK